MSEDKKTFANHRFYPPQVLKKIVAGIKKDAKFLMDVVVDETGIKKIERHIEVSQVELEAVKASMTELLKAELQSNRKLKILKFTLLEQESLVIEAIQNQQEEQAFKLAAQMVEAEFEYNNQLQIDHAFKTNIIHLQAEMEQAQRQQKELERQLAMVNTTQQVKQASDAIINRLDEVGGDLLSAKALLNRTKMPEDEGNQQSIKNEPPFNEIEQKRGTADEIIKRLKDH